MTLGSNKKNLLIIFITLFFSFSFAEDKITSSPLINLEKIKPSFEEVESVRENLTNNELIKNKKKTLSNYNSSSASFIGLDKITAKTSEIKINLGETKKYGPLEIKVLKCTKFNSKNINDNVAYLQVKDLTQNHDEKIFIFNGWTFSSDPSIAPFDHAIYDLQLTNCNKI